MHQSVCEGCKDGHGGGTDGHERCVIVGGARGALVGTGVCVIEIIECVPAYLAGCEFPGGVLESAEIEGLSALSVA